MSKCIYIDQLFQHPWAVVFLKDEEKEVHCSGSLIHPSYVITAGHCFVDKQGDYPPNPSLNEIVAAFGLDDVNDVAKTFLPIQKKMIKKVHFHQDYSYPRAYRYSFQNQFFKLP